MNKNKFRAWDTQSKCWMSEEWVAAQSIWQLDADQSIYRWVQFTGLKDKNGTDIFEGGVVQGAVLRNMEVAFEGGRWIAKQNGRTHCSLYDLKRDKLEVIGNIYENGELLK